MSRINVFECTCCEVCCSTFKTGTKNVNKDEFGVFYTMEQTSRVLSLWSWEKDRFERLSNEHGLDIDLKPLTFLVDKRNSRAIVLVWYVDHKVCPFLEEKSCKVWEHRPFSCKSFPLFGERNGLGLSSLCPDLVRPPLGDNEVENGKILMQVYPDEVLNLFKDMEVYKMIFGFVKDLEKNDLIQWDKEADEDHAKNLIENASERIDLFDLVIKENILSKEEVQAVFEKLDSVEDLKGHVDLRISREKVDI